MLNFAAMHVTQLKKLRMKLFVKTFKELGKKLLLKFLCFYAKLIKMIVLSFVEFMKNGFV